MLFICDKGDKRGVVSGADLSTFFLMSHRPIYHFLATNYSVGTPLHDMTFFCGGSFL